MSPADVAVPVRALFRGGRNVRVLMDEVTDVDLEARAVISRAGRYGYDYLVLATGSEYAYFGQDRWRAHSLSLKTLEDALVMRERILLAFERAEMEPDETTRRRLMRFVVIGGGPTGVELAGAIAELAKSTLVRDFQRIRPGEAEIVLLEAGPSLLSGFPPAPDCLCAEGAGGQGRQRSSRHAGQGHSRRRRSRRSGRSPDPRGNRPLGRRYQGRGAGHLAGCRDRPGGAGQGRRRPLLCRIIRKSS